MTLMDAAAQIVRVGYQGEQGSNSLEAARGIVAGRSMGACDFLGLVSSIHVIESLVAGHCDYGVVAVRNSFAGTVSETAAALEGAPAHVLAELSLPVEHCLFRLPGVADDELTSVASHPQALAQTRQHRAKIAPQLVENPTPDTAISARWLAQGTLPPSTAVICSRQAGELYGLHLMAAGIQDDPDNHTDFVLLELDAPAGAR